METKKTALLVVDVQLGIFNNKIKVFNEEVVLNNICLLLDFARNNDMEVFIIQHHNKGNFAINSEGWKLHPKINPLENETLINKTHGSAFEETNLKDLLDHKHVKRVIITGFVTHGCFKATAISAINCGYEVIIAEDAHSSYAKDAKNLILAWNNHLKNLGCFVKKTVDIIN